MVNLMKNMSRKIQKWSPVALNFFFRRGILGAVGHFCVIECSICFSARVWWGSKLISSNVFPGAEFV